RMSFIRTLPARYVGLVLILGGSILWAYWPAFSAMAAKWTRDPQYSHAYLVPAFALFLLWFRRGSLPGGKLRTNWWGVLPLLPGLGFRLGGMFFVFDWLDGVSLLPLLLGTALLLGGWEAVRWSWLSIAFLVFMIPLPHRVETSLSLPLQNVATTISTY